MHHLNPSSRLARFLRSASRLVRDPAWTILSALVRSHTGCRVASGPFCGMHLPEDYAFTPALLGTYEKEIHSWINALRKTSLTSIVNIGAGDGVYAVGLALMHPDAPVLAYEMQESRRDSIQSLARLNGVADRIEIHGEFCENASDQSTPQSSLIVLDVEGAEEGFLTPRILKLWQFSTVLIETHDGFVPGNRDRLRRLFEPSHSILECPSRRRTLEDWPLKGPVWRAFGNAKLVAALSEDRQFEQTWLLCTPIGYQRVTTAE